MCRLVKRRLARITYAAAVLVPFSSNQGGVDSQTKLPVVVSYFVPLPLASAIGQRDLNLVRTRVADT